ncbi:MAG: transferrin-binding protein-like solute binding protein [Deltaproteobacteria bacterium]|nr:transferrin-binding protein-like solute binding protein [Deltaproteobacteria bacterium]
MKQSAFRPALLLLPVCAHLLFLLCLPPTLRAGELPEAAATVVALRGEVQAVSGAGESRSLTVKSPVHKEDTIRTGKAGRLQLLFTDNTIYSLGPDSEMKIAEYRWQAEEGKGALKTRVKEGVFRVMGGAITKGSPQNFTTETPAATIGIRGSMYAGTVTSTSLSVLFQGGKGIEVTNGFGTVAITRPGHGTRVQLNSAPEPPRRFSEQEVAAFGREVTGDDGDSGGEAEQETTGEEEETGTEESAPQDDQTGAGEDGAATEPPADTAADEQTGTAAVTDLAAVTEAVPVVAPVIDIPPPNEFAPAIDTTAPVVIPADGIVSYTGSMAGTATKSDGATAAINEAVWLEINWHNGRVLGRILGRDGEPPVFFIGRMSGSQIVDIIIMGDNIAGTATATDPHTLTFVSGAGSGSLSGAGLELLSMTAAGASYAIAPADQPLHDTWSLRGSATMDPPDGADEVSPRGVSTWKGFVAGVAEDTAAPDSNRRLFLNSSAADFAFTVDKDNGTLNGTLSAKDVNGSIAGLLNVGLGGALPSAFVLSDNLAAELGCAAGDCVNTSPAGPGGLKKYGNYLLSARPEDNIDSDYVTWGYWEVAYQDPASGAQYHSHVPGSRWIAGEPTPAAEVNGLVSANFIGHYSGMALASKIDPAAAQQLSDLRGTFNIDVDFGNINVASAVQGTIDLGEIVLAVNSGPAGNASVNGFSNTVNGVTGPTGVMTNSSFNGAFYGPNASAIGGNFHAKFSSGRSYTGIYGGNR